MIRSLNIQLKFIALAAVCAAVGLFAAGSSAQDSGHKSKSANERYASFCSSENWSGDNISSRDLRETTIPAAGSINVDAARNGGIAVKGEDRNNVMVRACVQAWGATEAEAKSRVAAVTINTSGTIRADSSLGDRNWSVSFQLLVPRSTNLQLSAHNGGISISEVDGTLSFETTNGGVSLRDISGDVRGKTTNGGVNVILSGASWRGSGLDVTTTNGGVRLLVPANYAAHVETGTVNGGFSSNVPGLSAERDDDDQRGHGSRPVHISTDINGGGATIRVMTTNGGVRISSAEL